MLTVDLSTTENLRYVTFTCFFSPVVNVKFPNDITVSQSVVSHSVQPDSYYFETGRTSFEHLSLFPRFTTTFTFNITLLHSDRVGS